MLLVIILSKALQYIGNMKTVFNILFIEFFGRKDKVSLVFYSDVSLSVITVSLKIIP